MNKQTGAYSAEQMQDMRRRLRESDERCDAALWALYALVVAVDGSVRYAEKFPADSVALLNARILSSKVSK